MKLFKVAACCLVFGSSIFSPASATYIQATPSSEALALAEKFAGSGIKVSNAVYKGSAESAGNYQNANSEAQDNPLLKSGIVLSSGNISSLNSNGDNNSGFTTGFMDCSGDSDLDELSGFSTFDASVLEFDFIVDGNPGELVTSSFWYVFGSEEYEEYIGTPFNDVFGFYIDEVNVASIPGTTTPVSINTINPDFYSSLYNSNVSNEKYSEMDGFTKPLYVEFAVTAGETHHMKLAIADATDPYSDSWVLLGEESFTNTPVNVPEPTVFFLLCFSMFSLFTFFVLKKTV